MSFRYCSRGIVRLRRRLYDDLTALGFAYLRKDGVELARLTRKTLRHLADAELMRSCYLNPNGVVAAIRAYALANQKHQPPEDYYELLEASDEIRRQLEARLNEAGQPPAEPSCPPRQVELPIIGLSDVICWPGTPIPIWLSPEGRGVYNRAVQENDGWIILAARKRPTEPSSPDNLYPRAVLARINRNGLAPFESHYVGHSRLELKVIVEPVAWAVLDQIQPDEEGLLIATGETEADDRYDDLNAARLRSLAEQCFQPGMMPRWLLRDEPSDRLAGFVASYLSFEEQLTLSQLAPDVRMEGLIHRLSPHPDEIESESGQTIIFASFQEANR